MFARLWWWGLQRLLPSKMVDGVKFMDLRRKPRSADDDITRLLGDAIHDIDWAGFGDWCKQHLALVVATDREERVIPAAHGYFCHFDAMHGDRIALACRLIWVAKYLELTEPGPSYAGELGAERVAGKCREAQLAFLRRFPDTERWQRFLLEDN